MAYFPNFFSHLSNITLPPKVILDIIIDFKDYTSLKPIIATCFSKTHSTKHLFIGYGKFEHPEKISTTILKAISNIANRIASAIIHKIVTTISFLTPQQPTC